MLSVIWSGNIRRNGRLWQASSGLVFDVFALTNGIPSHDTIARVFKLLEPDSVQQATLEWLKQLIALLPENVISVDGKTLGGSKRSLAGQKGLHILNAWSCANQICLGQLPVDDKSNEIPAVPE